MDTHARRAGCARPGPMLALIIWRQVMGNLEPEVIIVNGPHQRETREQRKRRETLRTAYKGIDLGGRASMWPPEPLPMMTRAEAISVGKRLWRRFAGRGWPG